MLQFHGEKSADEKNENVLGTGLHEVFIVVYMRSTNQAQAGLFVKYHRGHTLNNKDKFSRIS